MLKHLKFNTSQHFQGHFIWVDYHNSSTQSNFQAHFGCTVCLITPHFTKGKTNRQLRPCNRLPKIHEKANPKNDGVLLVVYRTRSWRIRIFPNVQNTTLPETKFLHLILYKKEGLGLVTLVFQLLVFRAIISRE